MFGTWFKQGDDKKDSELESAGHLPVSSHNASQPDTDSRPSLERAVTTAISSPHDAVLAELLSQRPDVNSSAKFNDAAETSSLKDEDVNSQGHHRAQSPTHEPLHDPFSGSIVGLTVPEQDGVDFESTEDELWTHMAHIREVQSQIANMHVMMEGVGSGTQGEQGATGRSVPLIHPSEGDKWDDEGDEEAEERKAREQEFARLAAKFNGRKEATANMMNKLDELSQVVRTFHALKTPMVDSSGLRSKDSHIPPGTGDSNHEVLSTAPMDGLPSGQKATSQLPFIESVSINTDRPSKDNQTLSSSLTV